MRAWRQKCIKIGLAKFWLIWFFCPLFGTHFNPKTPNVMLKCFIGRRGIWLTNAPAKIICVWNCQSMIKWSWQVKYSCLDSITSFATENPLLLLHCCRNSPQFIELSTLQKNCPKYGDYIVVSYCQSGKLPFMPHIWQFLTAHFPLYLQDSLHACVLTWYEAWSQSAIIGVLLSATFAPIYFYGCWLLLVFWN